MGCLHCFLETVMYEAITGSGDSKAANTNSGAQHCPSAHCGVGHCSAAVLHGSSREGLWPYCPLIVNIKHCPSKHGA